MCHTIFVVAYSLGEWREKKIDGEMKCVGTHGAILTGNELMI